MGSLFSKIFQKWRFKTYQYLKPCVLLLAFREENYMFMAQCEICTRISNSDVILFSWRSGITGNGKYWLNFLNSINF